MIRIIFENSVLLSKVLLRKKTAILQCETKPHSLLQELCGLLFLRRGKAMEEKRIALIGIVLEDMAATEQLNAILHDYSRYVIGRMGIPYRERGVNIISVAVDAPAAEISALSGKLGMIKGMSVKTIYAKAQENA